MKFFFKSSLQHVPTEDGVPAAYKDVVDRLRHFTNVAVTEASIRA